MIYFDTCYIVKCYISEHGSDHVRRLTQKGQPIASCMIARLEFAAALHRHQRQGLMTHQEALTVRGLFNEDIEKGYWTWLPLNSHLMEEACDIFQHLPKMVFLRSADALHLAAAKTGGFHEIFSNDNHVLKAASQIGLKGTNVIP